MKHFTTWGFKAKKVYDLAKNDTFSSIWLNDIAMGSDYYLMT